MDVVFISASSENKEKYQRELLYNHYLPYADQLDKDSGAWLEQIKSNLTKAVLLREFRPGVVTWMSRLMTYIHLYGFKFSKQDHIHFIHLAWEMLISPGMEPRLMEIFTRTLLSLLKCKSLLTPADLILDWRPLYNFYEDLYSHNVGLGMKVYPSDFEKNLSLLIKVARTYFAKEATAEILEELRPYFCPHDLNMSRAVSYLMLFLPTLTLELDKDNIWRRLDPPLYLTWLKELEVFWTACYNTPNWEGNLMSLMARLADDNIGLIDWTEETPIFFQRFMHTFQLPVYYKRLGVSMKSPVIGNSSIAKWIVATITPNSPTLDHLAVMISAINSYFYPTSEGGYSERLVEFMNKLIYYFMHRLLRERHDDLNHPKWIPANEATLTDDDIFTFCKIIVPVVTNMTHSKKYIEHARINLNILASIRADIFIPPLLDKLNASINTLTEPHKFTAAVKCVVSVARNLVKHDSLFPAGQSHVLQMLRAVLPGIDCNDIKKTMNVFQMISIFARLVPFRRPPDQFLNKERDNKGSKLKMKKIVSCQNYDFLGFVLAFMDKCFALIENSTLEYVRQEQSVSDAQMSNEESSINVGIISCFDSILHQADEEIIDAALSKLTVFLKGRILEPKVAGKIASGLCRTCARLSPLKTLQTVLPNVCSVLLELLRSTDLTCDRYLGDELMFNLLLLSDLVCLPGYFILPHMEKIFTVLQLALRIKDCEGHMFSLTIFRHCLHSLSHICIAERGGIVYQPSENPLHDWGSSGDLTQLNIKWYIPGETEFQWVSKLGDTVLGEQVDNINAFLDDKIILEKNHLHKCLKTISSFILGCSSILPWWEEEPIFHIETEVEHRPWRHVTTCPGRHFSYRLRNCENTRKFLVQLMDRLLEHLLEHRSDDTRALITISAIFKLLLFQSSTSEDGLEKHRKVYNQSKARLQLKILGNKKHIRAVLFDRILIQHEMRLVENTHNSFTKTHDRIFKLLFKLSTSQYSKVRSHAQSVLAKACKLFSYSYNAIVPEVLSKLHPDPSIPHEEFKGALYVILQNQMLVKHSWELQAKLWPLLVKAQHNEKPSITLLIRTIMGYIHSIDNWLIKCPDISAKCEEFARMLCSVAIDENLISEVQIHREQKEQTNMVLYQNLAIELCSLIDGVDLHWRFYNTCLSMLCGLLRYDVDFPLKATEIFTKNLIHDNILVRKASIHVVECILKKCKRKHPKISLHRSCSSSPSCGQSTSPVIPGCEGASPLPLTSNGCELLSQSSPNSSAWTEYYSGKVSMFASSTLHKDPRCNLLVKPGDRPDNQFLQYSDRNKPLTAEEYDSPRYVHKTHFGFYVWPKEDLIYAKSSEQPVLDRTAEEMSPHERIVYDFFTNENNIDKLFSFLTLEDKKGDDHFDNERFGMFKAIFRNFGDLFITPFQTRITELVKDNRESYQRAAAELIAAIIRGSKHWPFEKIEKLWVWVIPVIRVALGNVTSETMRDWGTCFATSSDNRDPNRLHWLMEVTMEEPIRSQGSFIDASRLYMLQGVVTQQRWRVGELLHRLLDFLIPFLDHPFQNVRNRLGAVLTSVFAFDLQFGNLGNASVTSPIQEQFVYRIMPQLEALIHEPANDDDESKVESKLRILQTVCKWIASTLAINLSPVKEHVFKFIPILMQFEWYERNPSTIQDCRLALSCLSRTLVPSELIQPLMGVLLDTIKSDSWKTRLSTLDFLQAFVFNNFMLIRSPTLQLRQVQSNIYKLVDSCLYDAQIEVRVKASQVYSGLVHCNFIPCEDYKCLISKFKSTLSNAQDDNVPLRHGCILGICAFLSAFPHQVPDYVPELLIYLGSFLNAKQPISGTVKLCVQNFKRTHQDNWTEHKESFSEDQLSELTNLLISPSYYA